MLKSVLQIFILLAQFSLSALIILCPIFFLDEGVDITITSLFSFVFVSIGSFVGGMITDKIGRQLSLFTCICFIFLGSIVMEYNIYAGLALAGLGIGPANSISFIIVSQTFQLRQILCFVILCGWSIGQIILGAIFTLKPDTHTFITICLMLPATVISVLTFVFIEQTPIFISQKVKINWKDIALLKSNIKQLILGCILMFTLQMFYYRTQFTLDRFGISLTLNTMVVGACELIANISCIFIVPKVKRKTSLLILFASMTTLFILLNIIKNPIVQTILQGAIRVIDCIVMAILAVYLPELFPTENRGRGNNFIMAFGVLGGGLSPLILEAIPWWGLLIFNIMAMSAAFFLKQTFKSNVLDKQKQSQIQTLIN